MPEKEKKKPQNAKKPQPKNPKLKPIPGVLTLVPLPSEEAKAIARYLADEVKFSIINAAASPLNKHYPKDSYAAVMQRYLKNNSTRQESIRTKAATLLESPLAKQQSVFGRFANKDFRAQKKANASEDPALGVLITNAFEKKLVAHEAFDNAGVFGPLKGVPILKTVLKIDISSGEFQGSNFYLTRTEIDQPQVLFFHWETQEPGATRGRWEIKRSAGNISLAVAEGTSPVDPGRFSIDFHDYLQPTPPSEPLTYLVRVQPEDDHAASVGNPSNWVTLIYKQSPGQEFDMPPTDTGHYQHIEFCINSVKCIEETGEYSDSDEILLGGATVLSGGKVFPQGVWTVSDDFDKGEVEPEPSHRPIRWSTFKLFPMAFVDGNLLGREPTDNHLLPWPKAFTFTLVMVEKDTGGFEEIIANLIIRVTDYLTEWVEKIAKGYLAQYVGEEAAGIIAMVIGAFVTELFDLFKEIIDDSDDEIDQKTFVLWLESSRVSFIHSLPGHVNNLGQAFNLITEQTEFVSNPQVFRFQGGDNSAGGIYDVEVFWKANYRYFNY